MQNWIEFESDYGPPLVSKRGTAVETMVEAQVTCPREQADFLSQFFRVQCAEGSLNFTKDGTTYRWAGPPSRLDYSTFSIISIRLMEQP